MRRFSVLLILLISIVLSPVFSQAAEDPPPPESETAEAATQEAVPGEPESPEEESSEGETEDEELSLLRKTLKIDIDTAGYFELLAWCKRVGVSEKGDKQALVDRLYGFYGLSREAESAVSSTGKRISIESAKTTEYFTVEQVEEDYIIVKGDVFVRIEDRETGSEHSISAGEIHFNQTKNLLTAFGDVTYTLIEDGKEETFFGESLHFSLDTWEGVFFEGVSLSNQQVGEETVTFRYYGDTIYRSDKDSIRLENGVISSSKPKEPYYRIEAKKIWVLAPGEWAILGASIYVGEVPMLYVPFFFKNRDKVVFRPAMGFRDKGGFFLQTTTYFVGEPDTAEDTLSFLQIGSTEQGEYKKELKGIYLRTVGELNSEEREQKQFLHETGTYGKLMFDTYSRLGFYSGLEVHIGKIDWMNRVFLYGGIARSRDIYIDPETGWYTPYYVDEEGIVSSRWNTSWIGKTEVPFRYGMHLSLTLNHSNFSLDSNIESFSDPYFTRDFFDRSEETKWREFIGIGEETDLTETTAETDESGAETSRLSWYAKGTLTPNTEAVQPYISAIRIDRADVGVNWKNKELGSAPAGLTPEEYRTEYSFPEKRFFYPDTVLLPSLSGNLAGRFFEFTLPSASESEKAGDEPAEYPGKGLVPPWEKGADSEEEEEVRETGGGFELRVPGNRGAVPLPVIPRPVLYRQSLSYSLSPSLSVDHRLDSSQWASKGDIDFAEEYSLFYTENSFEVTSQSDFYDSLATVKDTVSLSGTVKDHFNRSDTVEDEQWQSYKQDDYTSNTFIALNTLAVSLKPLMVYDPMKKSAVNYQLQTVIFKKEYSETDGEGNPVYSDSFASWDKEYIRQHSISSTVIYTILDADQKLSLSYVLPPLLQDFSLALTLTTGPFTHYLAWGRGEKIVIEDPEEIEWKMKPLELMETFTLDPYLTLQQRFLYSSELKRWSESRSTGQLSFFDNELFVKEVFTFGFRTEEELEGGTPLFDNPLSSVTELRLWWFSTVLTASHSYSYEIDPDVGWIQQEDRVFQPESLKFALQVQPKIDPFWKNRIRFGLNLQTGWNISLLQYTNSSLTFGLKFSLDIHQFLKLEFGIQSENTEMYRYFKKPTDELGVPTRNFLGDLLKSMNIFNIEDRIESPFNAKTVSLALVHRLRDWDLNIDYSGNPALETDEEGVQSYTWDWSVSVYVQWNPIPEIKRKVQANDDQILY